MISGIIFLLITIPVATYLVKQNQDTRQRADEKTPTVTPSPTPTGPTLDSEEQNFINILNQHRQSLGLTPLIASVKLTEAAEWMVQDMKNTGKLSHIDSLGRDPKQRMAAFGYTASRVGENVAQVGPTGQDVFNAWMASTQGHKEEMEEPVSRAVGIARLSGGPLGTFWVADFGSSLDEELSPAPTTEAPTPTQIQQTGTPTPTTTITPTVATLQTPTPSPTTSQTQNPTPTPTATLNPTMALTATPFPSPTGTPTSTPTPVYKISDTPTPTPTIAPPGATIQTVSLIIFIGLVVIGGIVLMVL